MITGLDARFRPQRRGRDKAGASTKHNARARDKTKVTARARAGARTMAERYRRPLKIYHNRNFTIAICY